MAPILVVDRLSRRFGGLQAVDDLSFSVAPGEIRGLIGPNGAGKTTTFNVISGFYPPSRGRILFQGEAIGGLPTSRVAARGLVRTFQHTTLFQELSVLDNVRIGGHLQARRSVLAAVFGRRGAGEAPIEARARDLLARYGLAERADEPAAGLPHGLQRALGIAIALMARPRLLLLDEPFTGMNPEETRQMMALIRRLRDDGVTVLLVEHDMQAVMGLCDRITVLNFGRLLCEGTPAEVRADPAVVDAYLGAPQAALEPGHAAVH